MNIIGIVILIKDLMGACWHASRVREIWCSHLVRAKFGTVLQMTCHRFSIYSNSVLL